MRPSMEFHVCLLKLESNDSYANLSSLSGPLEQITLCLSATLKKIG